MSVDHNSLNEIGKNAYQAIVDMVYALDVDYDELDALRDRRDENDLDGEELEELAELEDNANGCDNLRELARLCCGTASASTLVNKSF